MLLSLSKIKVLVSIESDTIIILQLTFYENGVETIIKYKMQKSGLNRKEMIKTYKKIMRFIGETGNQENISINYDVHSIDFLLLFVIIVRM